jgi:hypothetical protein
VNAQDQFRKSFVGLRVQRVEFSVGWFVSLFLSEFGEDGPLIFGQQGAWRIIQNGHVVASCSDWNVDDGQGVIRGLLVGSEISAIELLPHADLRIHFGEHLRMDLFGLHLLPGRNWSAFSGESSFVPRDSATIQINAD